jgi:hypothetical protein
VIRCQRFDGFRENEMRALLMIGLAGLITVALTPRAPAQDLGRILHAITEPDEAHRYEEQAHRNGRPNEEHYWHQYGASLQAQRYEEQAHRNGRPDEEHYWHDYRQGLAH